jgi:EF-P beta-lysylation protein EpmB
LNTPQPRWQQELRGAFRDLGELCEYLNLDIKTLYADKAQQSFPLRVPKHFADCMEKGNINDPLLRQVLPIEQEMASVSGFGVDPVGDLQAIAETGVIHKYQGRALLINTGHCAIHCRYCFRRHFPYHEIQLNKSTQHQALAYLQKHTDIHEVILSGGDPLLLPDAQLLELILAINEIGHIKRIRFHTRLPIVLPARINNSLMTVFSKSTKQLIMVVHCNHANELSGDVRHVCEKMRQANISLLNQSVLLKGVNDDVVSLKQLSETLFSIGVLPYYLHLLDKAAGTAHFAVNKATALLIMQQLQATLSGYLVPKLVQEDAGKKAKTLIF